MIDQGDFIGLVALGNLLIGLAHAVAWLLAKDETKSFRHQVLALLFLIFSSAIMR